MNPREPRSKGARASGRSSSSTAFFSILLGLVVVLCAAWALSSYRNNTASVGGITTGVGQGGETTAPKSESKVPPSAIPTDPAAR